MGKQAQYEELVALANVYLGYEQSNKGLFADSSVSLKNAFQIFEKRKDTANRLSAKNGLAILNSKNTFYEEAKKERVEAIKIAKKITRTVFVRLAAIARRAHQNSKRAA
jgi:hypothetical protein